MAYSPWAYSTHHQSEIHLNQPALTRQNLSHCKCNLLVFLDSSGILV
jgi:hypothetical protein